MIDRIPIAIDALGDGVLTALADATRGEKLSPGLRAELGVAVRAKMLRRVDDDDRTDGKTVTFRLEVLTFDQVDLAGREVLGLADAADRCKALALVMGDRKRAMEWLDANLLFLKLGRSLYQHVGDRALAAREGVGEIRH